VHGHPGARPPSRRLGLGAAGTGTLLFTVLGPAPAPGDWPPADAAVFLVEAALFAATALAVHRVVSKENAPQT
jgi:hypothetical protein